jgi:hypothetical protein
MIEHLVEESEALDEWKSDYGPAPVDGYYRLGADGRMQVSIDIDDNGVVPYDMTEWAFRQMCGRLGKVAHPGSSRSLPATYLLACPAPLRAENVNHWIDRSGGERWFARTYKDEVRAILSDRYATLDNTTVLKWTDEALETGNASSIRTHNTTLTADVLHLRVLFREVDANEGAYAIGAYITNGEIGNRRMGVYPLVQRHSCTNSIMIPNGKYSWDHRHIGNIQVRRHTFAASIFEVLDGAAEALERLMAADDPLPDFEEHLDRLVEERGWTSKQRDQILIGTEGRRSLFGIVQGVSSAANEVEDSDEQADLQMEAGQILFQGV